VTLQSRFNTTTSGQRILLYLVSLFVWFLAALVSTDLLISIVVAVAYLSFIGFLHMGSKRNTP
jgi:hypothetical protein